MKLTLDRAKITPTTLRYFELSDEDGTIYIYKESVDAYGVVMDSLLTDVDGDEVKHRGTEDEIERFIEAVAPLRNKVEEPVKPVKSKKKKNKCRECGGDPLRQMDESKPFSYYNTCPSCGKN